MLPFHFWGILPERNNVEGKPFILIYNFRSCRLCSAGSTLQDSIRKKHRGQRNPWSQRGHFKATRKQDERKALETEREKSRDMSSFRFHPQGLASPDRKSSYELISALVLMLKPSWSRYLPRLHFEHCSTGNKLLMCKSLKDISHLNA